MKKISLSVIVLVFFSLILISTAMAKKSDTKYPVVLAHGMGASAEIAGLFDYWWGIKPALEKEGCNVFITSVNGMDSTANKAKDFKRQVMDILALTGASKVNIIGHSHGTIYTRYAISNLGLAPYVASHTSIAGPHRGSAVADGIINGVPDFLHNATGDLFDFIYTWLFGDTNPDSLQNCLDLTTDYMINVFNKNTPNYPNIYYQSWAAKAKWGCPSIILTPTWLYMLAKEGANDGLVSVTSAKWGKFRGVEDAAWYSPGCDHLNIVGMFFGITPGFDAPGFYVKITNELKNKGY